jgi:hypothetical protein
VRCDRFSKGGLEIFSRLSCNCQGQISQKKNRKGQPWHIDNDPSKPIANGYIRQKLQKEN